jgi:lambda family phage portal protein
MKLWPFGSKSKKPAAKRMFGGAVFNRLTSDWNASIGTSQDSEIRSSLRVLRNRTRQLARDNDWVKNALRAIQNNVIGTGIGMQMQVKMQRQRNGKVLNQDLNEAIEDAWSQWCKASNCHTAGLLNFSDIERLLISSCAENGEVLVRIVKGKAFGTSPVPMALEVIESDQLQDERNGTADNGNIIRMGVEKDEWGRPVAYWFYPYHPGDYLFKTVELSKYKRVDAEEIIHLYKHERPGQTRGVPWFASALRRMHQVAGFEEAEVVAARASASIMGFINTPDGELQDDGVQDGQRVSNFEPGKIEALGPGETFTAFTPTRPGGQYDPFVRAQLRAVAAGVGVSYETLSKDYSQSNYSSSRLALLDDRDNWRSLQQWMIKNFHQKVFETWLDMAVLSGALDLPNYEINPDAYRAVRWMPRGWSWVDPAKEVAAYKEAVRCGFMTQSEVVAQTGCDIEDLLMQRQREVEMAEALGLVFDTDAAQVNDKGQTQPAPAPAAAAEEAAPGDAATDAAAAPADDSDADEPTETSSQNL